MPHDRNEFTLKELGKYDVFETLGSGSFGEVKRVVNRDTKEEFAMKILSIEKIKENRLTDQVKREISILRQLDHPNIVRIVEVLKNKRHMFLITELVNNGDLFDRLALQHKFSENEARDMFKQMLSAVAYCHARGIAHRDLKIENIFLTNDMQIKVGDFGFANACLGQGSDQEIALKTLCGTPSSLPPEILRHESYLGSRVDLWCLGIILYTMVAGRLPFPYEDNDKLFEAIVDGNYSIPDYFSPNLKDLIAGLIKVDSEKRFTMTETVNHAWMTVSENDFPSTTATDDSYSDLASQDTMVVNRR